MPQVLFAPQDFDPLKNPEQITQQHSALSPLVLFCSGLGALSGISTDIMLPAFSDMATGLDSPIDRVQATVSVFALFFGLSQMFYGPFSDRFGRKPAVAIGMSIYLMGSFVAVFAFNIETLLLGRALQGAGCGAGPVIARAILRDTHSGISLARAMATTFAIFGLGPILAPFIGYFLNDFAGWRMIFAFVGALALILLAYDLLRFQETIEQKKPDALNPKSIIKSIKTVLNNSQSRYFILCAIGAYCALFSYIANAPVVYEVAFGVSGFEFAALFGITGFGIIIGQIFNRTFLPRLGVLNMLKIASLILFAATGGIAVCDWMGLLNEMVFTLMMFFFNTSFLVTLSNTATLTLDPHPKIAGLTSAFFGMATTMTASLFILLTVKFVGGDATKWSLIMATMTGITAALIWSPTAKWVLAKNP